MTLSALSVASGNTPLELSPPFSPDVTQYTATVPDGAEGLTFTFSKTNPDADWGRIYAGGATHQLASGVVYFEGVEEAQFFSQLVPEESTSTGTSYTKRSPQRVTMHLTAPPDHPDYKFESASFSTAVNHIGIFMQYTVNLVKA